MIDEVYEVKEYLSGKSVSERGRYRAAYLIARWYTQEGKDFREVRNAIFDWAKHTGNYIKYNVNDIITSARSCTERLKDNVIVCVGENDINQIVLLFDSKKARMTALAMLCYAKVYANAGGEFNISTSALAEWIGVSRSMLLKKYIPELETLSYIEKVTPDTKTFTWHKGKQHETNKYVTSRFRILAPLYNDGKYQLVGNNIKELYDEIFEQTERTVFNIPEVEDGTNAS